MTLQLIGNDFSKELLRDAYLALFSIQLHQKILETLQQLLKDLFYKLFSNILKQEERETPFEFQSKNVLGTEFVAEMIARTTNLILDICATF